MTSAWTLGEKQSTARHQINPKPKYNVVKIMRGDSPLILGIPHTGTYVPSEIFDRLNDIGKRLADTDWHVHRLHDGLVENVTSVRALFHRYVIDANRDPSGRSLYPGQNTTELCPTTNFDNNDIYLQGQAPIFDGNRGKMSRFPSKIP